MIPYGRQEITDGDIEQVVAVLRSDFLTQGPMVPRFEQAVAQRVGAAHAVAVNSATSALHIACMALDLGPGDWLWTTPNTFAASANCGLYCGAQVDFVDIDPATRNMSSGALASKLEKAKAVDRLPKVVVPVHFAGEPCDLKAIRHLADQYGFRIIDDASHAIGGRYAGDFIGASPYSDVTIFSFHPVKIITTAEGGMALTADAHLASRMSRLRTHGITRDAADMTRTPDGPWYYEQLELGYNYRMTEIQAALGLSQLDRLDQYVAQRHVLADRYDHLLAGLPLKKPVRNPSNYSGLHLYVVELDCASRRREIFEALRARGIGVNVHYIPVHLHPHYQAMGFRRGDFPAAEKYYDGAITLPLYATLAEEEQDQVVHALRRLLT